MTNVCNRMSYHYDVYKIYDFQVDSKNFKACRYIPTFTFLAIIQPGMMKSQAIRIELNPKFKNRRNSVSYTHLTLPTIYSV